jgi:hypothetical protein
LSYLSSFCWGKEVSIHFLHFPLNPLLVFAGVEFPCLLFLLMLLFCAVLLCYWLATWLF